ncbi:MAG: 3-oxoacyl-[acyl-carrier-protein] synthase III C-terminal domain-containing protein [Polyangiales bacterium]|nr:hypothetical protein [Sandaracinaceae bacterium]
MTAAYVSGLGTWLPDTVRTNDAWPAEWNARRESVSADRSFVDIPTHTTDRAGAVSARYIERERADAFLGVRERRVAEDAMTAREAETQAAHRALADANLSGEEVDVVLSWAMVPDRVTPSSANYVAHAIGARRATAWGVDAACASALVQLQTAAALVASGQARVVLATQSHLMLRAFPMSHPASPGLGDGASAFVVTRAPGPFRVGAIHGVTLGEHYLSVAFVRDGDPDDAPWFCAGGASRLGSVDGEGARYLMKETVRMGVATMEETARAEGIRVQQLDTLCSVQPRGWTGAAIAECLDLGDDAAVDTYASIGHLGGCGPVVNWHAARERGRLPTGAILGLYAQGAGFTRMGAIVHCE